MRLSLVELVLFVLAALVVASTLPRCGGSPSRAVMRASWTLTPGVLNPAVTPSTIRVTICRRGWTKTIRPPVGYTNELKLRQLLRYGLHGPPSAFQEDHLISLELGGHPTDPRNLWPEPYPRASEVDSMENDLNAKVCSGRLSLERARLEESELKHRDG
jgi:hypothetical protein